MARDHVVFSGESSRVGSCTRALIDNKFDFICEVTEGADDKSGFNRPFGHSQSSVHITIAGAGKIDFDGGSWAFGSIFAQVFAIDIFLRGAATERKRESKGADRKKSCNREFKKFEQRTSRKLKTNLPV